MSYISAGNCATGGREMQDRKVFLNNHTNLLELEEHMYPLVDVDTPNVFRNLLR